MRLNLDGSIPADNPDLSAIHLDWRHEIYAYGFRNPFRIAFRKTGTGPSDYQVFVNDVGSSGGQRREEINRIQPGGNYGWPNVEGFPRCRTRSTSIPSTLTTMTAIPSSAEFSIKAASFLPSSRATTSTWTTGRTRSFASCWMAMRSPRTRCSPMPKAD
jgi:glucose/arabinose dehydrogenase